MHKADCLLTTARTQFSTRYAATSAAFAAAPAAVSSVVVGVPIAAVAWGKRAVVGGTGQN